MFYSMRSGIWAKTGPHAFAARVEYKTSLVAYEVDSRKLTTPEFTNCGCLMHVISEDLAEWKDSSTIKA